ncbi:ATP-binding protein [Gemella haemolysans]|uniref:histidine kinase n=1 Tax=Gemella haemolysans ATCC 10379 TaxID=546270 RepID=C5NVQ2_9BACL|nr:ATP-binding protein [Gemella haemolysans]EER68608.1 sensor protein kinase WalK [Gemella haemolysans ATCC 10379]KAA8708377.1 cell wall metabolism sensor histidine kinase WalK [Gemella haemolysans]UBH82325.1 cell wall metabolism sensor histidine kinase WalK [Gemella haemolysans]
MSFFEKRFKKRFFSSIRTKFVIVYVLVNIISLQLIGLFFTTQLRNSNINTFEQNIIEQEKILNYHVREELEKASGSGGDTSKALDDTGTQEESTKNNKDSKSGIAKLVSEFNIQKLLLVNVIDNDSKIIATSSKNGNDEYLAKRSFDPLVSQVIKTGESTKQIQNNTDSNKRVWIYVSPVKKDNEVVGVISLMADIESVYQEVNSISKIFIVGTILSILITTVIGFVASKTVTSSIEKMSSQVKKMALGNYGTVVGIDTDDEIGDLAKVFNQISKRIEEEQAVTETERRKLATIIESMMDGIITTDNNGRIILINTSAEDMLGGRNDEIFIGKDVLKILNITEYESIEEILEAEDSLLVNASKSDEELLLRAEISKIEKEDKEDLTQMSTELEGYIIVLYDVTDQERQEKERREFVSTVSHELRTPLTTMNSYIEALEEGVLEDKELAPQFIDTIHKETTRMIRMVNELMQLGKMDIKEEHYEKEFIDINKMLEQITDRFALTHPEKNFIKHIPKSPIFVEGDQDKLTQVFDNIVNNAIKYSPNGKNITVRVRQNYHHNRVSISIKDEGVGIPLVHIDKIFNRFYRVDKSRQRSMGGTGLGLALAKTIVEAHKGRIWAQSREGYGSIIFVTLPCEQIDDEWL